MVEGAGVTSPLHNRNAGVKLLLISAFCSCGWWSAFDPYRRPDLPSMRNLLRRAWCYYRAQRLVPAWLPATERELRRWNALGEAYVALLEIASDVNPISRQEMKRIAKESADRVRESCRR